MLIKILDREFDEDKIKRASKLFDREHAKDYEDYLLSIAETEVPKIPIFHAYNRVKLISMEKQPKYLLAHGYVPINQRNSYPIENNKSSKTRNWGDE